MKNLKSLTAYLLIGLILLITVISLLGVWDIISLEDVLRKIISSLLIIFVAAAVALFIFSVMIKDDNDQNSPTKK
jgi:glucan phosphoethanolaminetransferase (alkaline phosphatase superfamily)